MAIYEATCTMGHRMPFHINISIRNRVRWPTVHRALYIVMAHWVVHISVRHLYVYVRMHAYMRACKSACIRTCAYEYMYECSYMCIHLTLAPSNTRKRAETHKHLHLHICTYRCTPRDIHMHRQKYVHKHAYYDECVHALYCDASILVI